MAELIESAQNSTSLQGKEEKAPQVRVVFMGTPDMAAQLLFSLIKAGYNIVAVVTKPITKQGRKGDLTPNPVHKLALQKNIPVLAPHKLNDDFRSELEKLRPDLILVAAYGKILPKYVLDIPGLGCLNVHYSLLPRFRGASPIQHALLYGDTETGVTLMKMDTGLDTGDIIAAHKISISPDDTTETLTPQLTKCAEKMLIQELPLWIKQKTLAVPQSEDGILLCQLIERSDGKITWSDSAQDIYNRYRAFYPWPGIYTFWKRQDTFLRIKLHQIRLVPEHVSTQHQRGEVFQSGNQVCVQTGMGAIAIEKIQVEGKSSLEIADFLRGNPDFIEGCLV